MGLKRSSNWLLAFLALGVVFGDIGTSPLYALRETFFGHYRIAATFENILGALSLFFWSLAIVITAKYVFLIIRADNEGEGGVFSLLGLIRQDKKDIPAGTYGVVTGLILFGAALLYGDGIITPAISVLSAVEGIAVAVPGFENGILPITLAILFVLFFLQKRGTYRVGKLFSPIMAVWFLVLVVMAVPEIVKHPSVIRAVNPYYGILFLWHHGFNSLWILGAVVLCVTGGEALYADLGHLGRDAITRAWLYFVYPALLINYFGQGARLMDPEPLVNNNLFYGLVPSWAVLPMVILSTAATVIASQALISGSYSLTHQAIALGVFPRLKTYHTNPDIKGQIYLPAINWMLFAGCSLLVVFFKSSGNLAAAYGIAVTGTMAVTTAAFFVVALYRWRWPLYFIGPVCGLLIGIDLTFFSANILKFFQGGFVPILLGLAIFGVMWAWKWGRATVAASYAAYESYRKMGWLVELKTKLDSSSGVVHDSRPRWLAESDRVVVFMTSRPVEGPDSNVPTTLRVHIKRTGVLPKNIVILTVVQEKSPFVKKDDRYRIINFGHNMVSVQARFGFMEEPNAKKVIRELREQDVIRGEPHRCSIETGEEDLFIKESSSFKDRIFVALYELLLRFSSPAHHYFGLRDAPGLARTIIPISISRGSVKVEIPELAFDVKEEKEDIDPDTLKPSETEFAKIP